MIRFDANLHHRAQGLTLVRVVSLGDPENSLDVWLHPDGVHLSHVWDITKAGHPDKRKRPDSLLYRIEVGRGHVFVGHYLLDSPENIKRARESQTEIKALALAKEDAIERRNKALAISPIGGAS